MNARTSIVPISLLSLLPALLLSGCGGYKLGSIKPTAYQHIETIYVPTFHNDTLEPRLGVLVTNAVISQLQQDGTYRIVAEDQADATLLGRIRQIRRFQQRSTQTQVLQSRELVEILEVTFRLEDPLTGRVIQELNPFGIDINDRDSVSGQRAQAGRVAGQTSVFLDENFELSERQALSLAAQDAAEQIVAQITEGW